MKNQIESFLHSYVCGKVCERIFAFSELWSWYMLKVDLPRHLVSCPRIISLKFAMLGLETFPDATKLQLRAGSWLGATATWLLIQILLFLFLIFLLLVHKLNTLSKDATGGAEFVELTITSKPNEHGTLQTKLKELKTYYMEQHSGRNFETATWNENLK